MTKRWVGRWIVLVGAIHCAFGAVVFIEPLSGILRDGLWNAVSGYQGRPLAFWFELAGILMVLLGIAVDQIEKNQQTISGFLSFGFAILTVLAIVAMPMSGGWLLAPGVVGLFMKTATTLGQINRSQNGR